jgi:threonine dehydratase
LTDIAAIEAAAGRLRKVAVITPLIENETLNQRAGGRILIKPECLQRTGSFKIRGAYNLLSQLSEAQAARGVVAWSSGNHAQGVAAAAARLGIHAAVVMPEDAPRAKLENTRRLGAEVITYDRYRGNREEIAIALANERGAELVPSYDHSDIISGQGTVGLEIADQCRAMALQLDQALICCGGGGLSSGSAVALKDRFPSCQVHTVEPVDFDDTARSLLAGERLQIDDSARSICDALQSPSPGKLTFPILQALTGPGLTVSDAEVCDAMRFAFRHLKLVVEPGGAVALAAVLQGRLPTENRITAVVISGGNVDIDLFAEIQAEPA